MIISRTNLLVSKFSKNNKDIPMLDNVHIKSDGTSVGTNSVGTIFVSPQLSGKYKEVTLTNSNVTELLKLIPKNIKGNSYYETCYLTDDNKKIKINDGKQEKIISTEIYKGRYANYKKMFKNIYKKKKTVLTVLNLKELIATLNTVLEIIKISSKDIPINIEFTVDGDIIFRGKNLLNKHQIIGVLKAYSDNEGITPELTQWEKEIINDCMVDNDCDNNNNMVCNYFSGNKRRNQGRKRSTEGIRKNKKIKKIKRY